jgi:hypothetical protein
MAKSKAGQPNKRGHPPKRRKEAPDSRETGTFSPRGGIWRPGDKRRNRRRQKFMRKNAPGGFRVEAISLAGLCARESSRTPRKALAALGRGRACRQAALALKRISRRSGLGGRVVFSPRRRFDFPPGGGLKRVSRK